MTSTSPPQWSPALNAGGTLVLVVSPLHLFVASMEPGAERRGHVSASDCRQGVGCMPQWSPALNAGGTDQLTLDLDGGLTASMEPGAERRGHPI